MDPAATVTLPARQLFELTGAAGVRILCTAGSLWLTVDHDVRDIVLQPGDSFEPASPARVLLYAFEPSTFALAEGPARATAAPRSLSWRPRPALGCAYPAR